MDLAALNAVTPTLACACRQRLNKLPTDAPALGGFGDRELVEEDLCAFVRVGHLNTGDKADRTIVGVVGDKQVMVRVGKEARRRSSVAGTIEEMLGGDHGFLVARAERTNIHEPRLCPDGSERNLQLGCDA